MINKTTKSLCLKTTAMGWIFPSDPEVCFKWFNNKTPMLIFLTRQNQEHEFELLSKLYINQKIMT
jgi:hypothetical protein